MDNRSCKDCDSMKVKVPVESGRFIYRKAKAKCTDENGVLNRKGTVFHIGLADDNKDYVEWNLYGKLCRQFNDKNSE